MYQDVLLHIDGKWRAAVSGRTLDVINPATEEVIGRLAHASTADLDEAVRAAEAGFAVWRKVAPYDRSKIMRKAADLVRERCEIHRPADDPGAGQAAGGIADRNYGLG